MLNPKELAIFCKVATTGNMSRVAESEGRTVMAISKQIARLESQLNQPLFIRSRRQLVLTEFGKAFKYKAEIFLEQHQGLLHWSQNNVSAVNGELRVVCQSNDIVTESLVPWVAEFAERYPDLILGIDVKESLIDIREDEYDVFWAVGEYLGNRYPGLKRRSIWKSRYGVFASPAYLKKFGVPSHPNQLKEHKVIGYLHNQPSNVLVLQDKNKKPLYATPHCQIKTVAGIVELAEAGLGLINAPEESRHIQQFIKQGKLTPVLKKYWWDDAEVYAYYHPSNPIQTKVRVFLDFFMSKRQDWQF
ncbi:LysR family transcriptional regulator [Alteromonas sediminis]|uniref:LysR family transcriptional regulator n=1 Tax=Alteromonas sediminis TaxID=2259342 RepID=A0A3N5Y0C2_9ALTE|nr:LysR family transcriptional regulator [Alteromonas sediminis]RPJ66510.1 LysR family transcriptional regulator [Alteromonas sediminis]